MRLSGSLPVVRRFVVALGVAGMVLSMASTANAQDAAAAQQAPAPPDPFKFDGANPIMLMLQINAGQEMAFEEAFAEIRKGLMGAEKPELQSQGRSLTLLRLTADLPPGQARPYVVYLDPPVAGLSYDFTQMLYYSGAWQAEDVEGRKVVDAIFEKLKVSVQQQAIWPLAKK
jgi:hypothetical protein